MTDFDAFLDSVDPSSTYGKQLPSQAEAEADADALRAGCAARDLAFDVDVSESANEPGVWRVTMRPAQASRNRSHNGASA